MAGFRRLYCIGGFQGADGLNPIDFQILDGMKAYYNFTKKHGGLKGKTPSEEALIKIDGKNRWKTIIGNSSLYKENSI